jgi:N-acetylneuraminic acid mutarotase
VSFSASLTIPTANKILKYGFTWSKGKDSNPTIDDYKILFEDEIKEGRFTHKITSGLEINETYNVRAYIKTEKHEVYGNKQSFVSQGTLPLKILDFTPKEGYAGQGVVIKVDNISNVKENVVVKFGEISAPIDSISDHNIYVKSPLIPENTDFHISVTNLENHAKSNQTYKVFYAWSQKNDFPGKARTGSISLSTDQKGYLIGGVDILSNSVIKTYTKVFYEYDPTLDSWSRNRDLPFTPYFRNGGFAVNNHLYVYSHDDNAFYIYNSEKDDWTLETQYPGPAGELLAFVINDEVFVGLSTWDKRFFKYSPSTKEWTEISSFPGTARLNAVSYTFKGKGFVGLGRYYNNNMNDFWSYDPINDRWNIDSYFPGEQRRSAITFTYNNKIYVGLGKNDTNEKDYKDIWEYQESGYKWIKKDDYGGGGLWNNISFSISGKAFVGTGSKGAGNYEFYVDDFWEFNL